MLQSVASRLLTSLDPSQSLGNDFSDPNQTPSQTHVDPSALRQAEATDQSISQEPSSQHQLNGNSFSVHDNDQNGDYRDQVAFAVNGAGSTGNGDGALPSGEQLPTQVCNMLD